MKDRTNRTSHLFVRLAVLATSVVGLVLVTAGQATARICIDPSDGSTVPCPTTSSRYDGPTAPPARPVIDNSDWTLQWVLLAAAVLSALTIVAVVADVLSRRRWRQPPLETALASTDLPRAAGLLGDLFVQQSQAGAAAHAFRAAIDAGDQYWSPIAQVALAQLLSDRGHRAEAQDLLEAAINSGHPRAVPAAQTSLDQLSTGNSHTAAAHRLPKIYETLDDTRA